MRNECKVKNVHYKLISCPLDKFWTKYICPEIFSLVRQLTTPKSIFRLYMGWGYMFGVPDTYLVHQTHVWGVRGTPNMCLGYPRHVFGVVTSLGCNTTLGWGIQLWGGYRYVFGVRLHVWCTKYVSGAPDMCLGCLRHPKYASGTSQMRVWGGYIFGVQHM